MAISLETERCSNPYQGTRVGEFNYRGWTVFRVLNDSAGGSHTILKIDQWFIAKFDGWLTKSEVKKLIDLQQTRLWKRK